jgi:hypothetical protein
LLAALGIFAVVALRHKPVPMANERASAWDTDEAKALSASSALPQEPSSAPKSSQPATLPPLQGPAAEARALEALTHDFPDDSNVLIALASAQAKAEHLDDALVSLDRALVVDPESIENTKAGSILWRGAQSPFSDRAFASLHKLGARGADILVDLATTAAVREAVRARARTELASEAFKNNLSPDTTAAVRLLVASDCKARKRLLKVARTQGGTRTLRLLEAYQAGTGCTPEANRGCSVCFESHYGLVTAITQIRARTGSTL